LDEPGGRLIRLIGAALPAVVAGALPLLFIPISVDSFILPRASLVLIGAGLGVVLTGWLRLRGEVLAGLGPLRWAALAVAGAAVLAAALSVSPWLSLVGSYSRYESLPMRLAYLGLFASAVWLLRSTADRQRVVSWFLAGCSLAAGEAVWQWGCGVLGVTECRVDRPDGNLGQPNLLGALLAMAVVLALVRAWRDRLWRPLLLLLVAGLGVCTSRSGWLGAVAGAGTWAALSLPGRRLALATLAGGALVSGLALLFLAAGPMRHLNADTGSARVGVWSDTVRVVAARPLTGWGEEGFGLVFGRYQSADWEPGHAFDRAHSQPLDLLAGQGVLGLGACVWLWGILWLRVWRGRLAPGDPVPALGGALAAYAVWSLVNFDWAPATGPAWLLAGVAWSAVGSRWGRSSVAVALPDRSASGLARLFPALAGTAVGVVSWVLALPPLVADLHYYDQRPAAAVQAWPWQARYHQALADALQGPERLEELRTAARLGSTDPSLWIALGDAEDAAGNHAAARRAWRQALDIYPYDETARKRLGVGARGGYSSSSS
jgi:O-antigen ligase